MKTFYSQLNPTLKRTTDGWGRHESPPFEQPSQHAAPMKMKLPPLIGRRTHSGRRSSAMQLKPARPRVPRLHWHQEDTCECWPRCLWHARGIRNTLRSYQMNWLGLTRLTQY